MNKELLNNLKSSPIWQQDFKDIDDILENGILKCDIIPLFPKSIISTIRTGDIIKSHAEKLLEQLDISIPQKNILDALNFSQNGYLTQKELSKFVYTSKANISSLLERMEAKGLIEREENKNNKREKLVKITKKGKEKFYTVIQYFYKIHANNVISDEDAKILIEILQKMRNNIKNLSKNI